ncbi:RNA-directed DNA polymerase [Neorhizobium galegae]|uniref:RNA-directed DNA polymerase n=1 Tax=Neorhizobium galegae TaxID=399 RepID=A0A6A1TUW0_NEOGA|nr:reverse transcriptase domain-containing protein [Neorhizobium galegae]KAB1087870.1 RNA-directed DNA polymerase [Neorhizobium galegae]
MPPRSYYNEPRPSDYVAFAKAFFPDELQAASEFAETRGLPYINSSAHIAAYLGVSASLLRQVIHKPAYHYREFPIKKASGADRIVSTPKTYLKVIQWWIADNILNKIQLSDSVHGFRRGKSYFTNASVHLNSKHILNVDVESFFDSITFAQITNVFNSLGYTEAGSLTLATLTSKNGIAPTGAPTSPMIANAILRSLDSHLEAFAAKSNLLYTRYADDLTFSSPEWIDQSVVDAVTKYVESQGFKLNAKKTKFMGPGDRMEVTGLVTNAGLNASKEWRNWARGFLHRVSREPAKHIGEIERVRGVYGVLRQLDPEKHKKLTVAAEQAMGHLADVKRALAGSKQS